MATLGFINEALRDSGIEESLTIRNGMVVIVGGDAHFLENDVVMSRELFVQTSNEEVLKNLKLS